MVSVDAPYNIHELGEDLSLAHLTMNKNRQDYVKCYQSNGAIYVATWKK